MLNVIMNLKYKYLFFAYTFSKIKPTFKVKTAFYSKLFHRRPPILLVLNPLLTLFSMIKQHLVS